MYDQQCNAEVTTAADRFTDDDEVSIVEYRDGNVIIYIICIIIYLVYIILLFIIMRYDNRGIYGDGDDIVRVGCNGCYYRYNIFV